MKRRRNRGGHATVLGFQPFKGLERGRVADHTRDLPPAGDVRGLARTRLGLHGSGVRGLVAADVGSALLGNFQRRPATNRSAIEANHEGAIGFSGDGHFASIPVQLVSHFVPRVEPIPTMGLPYAVTSDNATTVYRRAA